MQVTIKDGDLSQMTEEIQDSLDDLGLNDRVISNMKLKGKAKGKGWLKNYILARSTGVRSRHQNKAIAKK